MEREILIIPANKEVSFLTKKDDTKLRVAAYCRVSTRSKDQLHSYHTQIAYYIDLISKNENWEFVDLYADEGISGTKTLKRNEFKRMIKDCRKGMIDMVIVKSISRFARNVVDCLKYVRELRAIHVDVYFQNEKLHGIDPSSEFVLTMHAMHAQEQSVSTSNNKRWAIKKQMNEGTWIPTISAYGYQIRDYEFVKDEKISHVVDLIRNLYINGYSADKIKSYLEMKNIPSPKGNKTWSESTIRHILRDPMYRGDMITQKTYTTETFPFECKVNHGEMPKYYYEDDHDPYIEKEEGKLIDSIMDVRRSLNGSATGSSKASNRYWLSGKIRCHKCGKSMKRVALGKAKIKGYSCSTHIYNKEECPNKTVKEESIQKAFVRMFNKLKYNKDLLDDYLKDLEVLEKSSDKEIRLEVLKIEYNSIKKQIRQTALNYNSGLYESAFYMSEMKMLRNRAKENLEQQENESNDASFSQEIKSTRKLLQILNKDYLVEFDENIAVTMLDEITVEDQTKVYFHLINGMVILEKGVD